MYEEFYGLSADPFRLSSDHRFCFSHRSYARAKAYVQYALHRAEGFVMITGRPGTGKTTLINDLLESLPDKEVVVGTLVSTQLEAEDLLLMTGHAFGLDFQSTQKALVLQRIMDFLNQQHRQGLRTLLIIDEAQDLSSSALEELRLLTNLQRNGQPVLQIALLGQEALRDLVRGPQMEQVHQRLIAAWQLEPLGPEETIGYVRHRLERAGWRGNPSFQPGVLPIVFDFSQGVPRRINLICSRLLLHGFIGERETLTEEDAETVMADLHREELALPDSEWEPRTEETDRAAGPRRTLREGLWLEIDQGLFRADASGEPAPHSPSPEPQPEGAEIAGDSRTPEAAPAPLPEPLEPLEMVRSPPARDHVAPTAAPRARARTRAPDSPVSVLPSLIPREADTVVPTARHAGQRRSSRGRRSRRARWWLLLLLTALVLVGLFLSRPFIQGASLSAVAPGLDPADQAWMQSAGTAWDAIRLVHDGIVGRVQPADSAPEPAVAYGAAVAPAHEPAPPPPAEVAPPSARPEQPDAVNGATLEYGGDGLAVPEPSPAVTPEAARPENPIPTALEEGTDVSGGSEGAAAGSSENPGEAPSPAELSVAAAGSSDQAEEPAVDPPALLLQARVPFRTSSTAVDPAFADVLDDVVRALEQTNGAFAEVVGYTDPTGPVEYNAYLSLRRAEAVADRIVERGAAREQLRVRGHDPRENAIGRGAGADSAQDRRVEVTVWSSAEPQP